MSENPLDPDKIMEVVRKELACMGNGYMYLYWGAFRLDSRKLR